MAMAVQLRRRQRCTTGCPVLDGILDGGMPCGSVTELVGESTAGKTQLALQLLIAVQFPIEIGGLHGSALYIPTEGYFPGRRLRQIAAAFRASRDLGFDPCENVFVEAVESIQELFALLGRLEQALNQQQGRPVRLLLIDSVAALFRTEFDNNREEMLARSRLLFQLSAKLKKIADQFDLAVVVTNQVMDCVDGSSGTQIGNMAELVSSGRRVSPALGLSWSHCINTRLFLSRVDEFQIPYDHQRYVQGKRQKLDTQDSLPVTKTAKRVMHVVFAPHLPYRSCEFSVDETGVHGVPPDPHV